MAWDIETYKSPLKFPDSSKDPIICLSYMFCNTQGFLLINRQYFSRDIHDFVYSPRPEVSGSFRVYNFDDEKSMLGFFLEHVSCVLQPHIIVSYNGESFDFPYLHDRCAVRIVRWMDLLFRFTAYV